MRIHAIFGGIGAFAVKFRWVVIAAWLIAAFAVPRFLPSLSSVTQGNNSAFLPASAPSEQAAQLAAPFGSTNLIPVPVVAAVSQGTLTAPDATWLSILQQDLRTVPTVVSVRDLGRSADGQAEQLQVLSNVGGGDQTRLTTLVNDLRAQIKKAAPPPGLQVHLAGDIAINVDQQAKSGTTGNQVELLSVVFILVLLLLIFRSLLTPLITLIPAFLAVAISAGRSAHRPEPTRPRVRPCCPSTSRLARPTRRTWSTSCPSRSGTTRPRWPPPPASSPRVGCSPASPAR